MDTRIPPRMMALGWMTVNSIPRKMRTAFFGGLLAVLLMHLAACQAVNPPALPPIQAPAILPSPTVHAIPVQETSPPTPDPTLAVQPLAAPEVSTAAPAPTPFPTSPPAPALRQLTEGGCCVQPFWSPDSQRVLFLDRPSADAPVGIWAAGLDGGAPELFTDRLGLYSPDLQYLVYPSGGATIVERLADGQSWTIPSEGRAVSFSPTGSLLAWTAGQSGPPFDVPQRQVWISQVDGSQARVVATLFGGGFAGWLQDERILVSGRLHPDEDGQAYYTVSTGDGSITELARGYRLRGNAISPGGTWLAYQVTFSTNPDENGLWLVHTQTGERRKLSRFGSYRWRDDGRLLIIPLDLNSTSHAVWQIDAQTGSEELIVDPATTPIKIANSDWSVSPDGRHMVFVSSEDHNLWLITFPGG